MPGSVILLKYTDWQVGQGDYEMFAKKSVQLSIALVLLLALASLGLAYGAWSDTLTINGNVTTGNFNVWFYNMYVYWQSDYSGIATCDNTVSADGLTMTINVTNGYPGFECSGAAAIVNTGSVPAHINGLQLVSGSSESEFFTIELKNTSMVASPSGFDLPVDPSPNPPYTAYGAVDWTFSMPADETGGENQVLSFSYTILAEQDTP
jgi:hypothetical protein